MKLLIVTYGLNTIGGVQSWQHIFAHKLLARGHSIIIMEMYDYSNLCIDKKLQRQWDPNVKIIRNNGPIVQRRINRKTNWAAFTVVINIFKKHRLSKYLKKEKFDALLFTDPNFTFFFFKKALESNNTFVQFHSSFSRFMSTSRIRYYLIKKRYKSFKKFIWLTEEDARLATNNGFKNDKICYINNFIDDQKFSSPSNRNVHKKKQILIVGNLSNPDKQVDHALLAFQMIDKRITSEWKIRIIGNGDYINSLIQLSKNLGLSDKVIFAGKKENPVPDYFESSFFLICSTFEGGPLTLLECIHSALPVVSYNCSPFIKEIIKNNENGFIVEQNNIPELSRVITNMIQNPKRLLYMSESQDRLREKYSMENILTKWEELFLANQK